MDYKSIIDDFQNSFPCERFIGRDGTPFKTSQDFTLEYFEKFWEHPHKKGLFSSNLRVNDLKRALSGGTSGISDEILIKMLPAIEYTDLLLHYRIKYVIPMEEHKRNYQGSINKANDLIDLAKAMDDDETVKALELFRDGLVKHERFIQLTEFRIFDNFLFYACLLTGESTETNKPTAKIIKAVNYILEHYFETKANYTTKTDFANFLTMYFTYETRHPLEVYYSKKRAG